LSIAASSPLAAQATNTISGRVIDADSGQPVAAAQVTVAGTQFGRSTADDGRFTIASVPSGALTITVRRIGYQLQSRSPAEIFL